MLMLEPGKSDLADASLRPADVEISDIAAAAEGGARSLEYMVREVHARLADRLSQAVGPQGAIPTTFFVGILLLICPQSSSISVHFLHPESIFLATCIFSSASMCYNMKVPREVHCYPGFFRLTMQSLIMLRACRARHKASGPSS